jgi:hypothetical protein
MKSTIQSDFIRSLVSEIENELVQYYLFARQTTVADHLIARNDVKRFLGDEATKLKEWEARAAVWLEHSPEELFIGIHIQEDLLAALQESDPREKLCDENLDAFTTVVEEVSHFHLILNRMSNDRTVTKTELESQGEIDKLLLSALYLQRQHGDPHILHLARKLFDEAQIISEDYETYWQATKHAARFWFHVGHTEKQLTASVREALRGHYHASWREKVSKPLMSAA